MKLFVLAKFADLKTQNSAGQSAQYRTADFLRVTLASLLAHCTSAVALDRSRVQLAVCAFIHRLGSSSQHTRAFSYLCRRWRV